MALTNIFREPRREITESVVGIAVVALPIWGDYYLARWFQDVAGCPWPVGMLFGLMGGFLLAALAFLVHELGDVVCGILEEHGLRLRPKRRY